MEGGGVLEQLHNLPMNGSAAAAMSGNLAAAADKSGYLTSSHDLF